MITSPRRLVVLLLAAGCPYDPADPQFETLGDTDDTTSSGSSSVDTTMTTSDPDTTGDPTTSPTSTTATTEPTSDTTGTSAVCGDSEVTGDEVCDDGTNDGSYGGCMPDCSAPGPFCGDSEINGKEACDDGTNDGAYGGCATDCLDLAPHCGDGAMNGAEQCDNGELNENGSGCNVDCVISGTVVATFARPGLSFCDGSFTTPPVFRDDGNVLVSASGYCGDDSVVLLELSPDADIVQEFDDLLLPQTPVRTATLSGDDWILSSYGCDYAISQMGDLTEVCDDQRVGGGDGLDARDDGSYVAIYYQSIASYPDTSPMVGDTPDWAIIGAGDNFWDFYFADVAIGESDAAIVVGQRRLISNNTYSSYLARYTAAGNLVDSNSFAEVANLESVAVGGDGSVVVASGYPTYRVMKLDAGFDVDWSIDLAASSNVLLDVDSVGNVVFAYEDMAEGPVLRKYTPDGVTQLWTLSGAAETYGAQMAIAPDDHVWLSAATFNGFAAIRVSP